MLSTAAIQKLNTAQIGALTAAQVCALTTTQVGALTTAQIGSLGLVTPVILDLNGDGVKTLSINTGVKFDILANGSPIQTGWVAPQDGLLVSDRNQDGLINDGSELFGSSTLLADGQNAIDGYQALSEYDSNRDGVVSEQDVDFGKLSVWVDGNSDGLTKDGELKTLSELGITQLSVKTEVARDSNEGNLIGLTSTYQTNDGQSHSSADVWFVVDREGELASTSVAGLSKLSKAITEFKDSLREPHLQLVGHELTSAQSHEAQTFVGNVKKMNAALKNYRDSTIDYAHSAIQEFGAKNASGNLASPLLKVSEAENIRSDKLSAFDYQNKSK